MPGYNAYIQPSHRPRQIYSYLTSRYLAPHVNNNMHAWISDVLRFRQLRRRETSHYVANSIMAIWNCTEQQDMGRFVRVMSKFYQMDFVHCPRCVRIMVGTLRSDPTGSPICNDCFDSFWFHCDRCDTDFDRERIREANVDGGRRMCHGCAVAAGFTRCGHCYGVYHNPEHGCPRLGCRCKAKHPDVIFPNGDGTISTDEMATIELPGGMISDEGIRDIYTYLIIHHPDAPRGVVNNLDREWQMRSGTFTKRLARAMYKYNGYKASDALLAGVGNIARQHSATGSQYRITVTRNMNLSAKEFYHSESCWWTGGSYGKSRCAFKTMHGIGLRSWDDHNNVTGRAWILAFDADMFPTEDAVHAHAYLIFNCYGALSGYTPARIVSMMTGKSYKRIGFQCSPMYVNGEFGYLVADQDTCKDYHGKNVNVRSTAKSHHDLDDDRIEVY